MAGSTFFRDELRKSLDRTITQRFRELPFENGTDIPTDTMLEPGVKTLSVDVLSGYGEATLRANGSNDANLVQINMTRDEYPVVMSTACYAIDFDESRAAEYTGKTNLIRDQKTLFTRRAIAERLNRFAAFGEPVLNVRGMVNNSFVTVDNNSFNPNTATFDQCVAFFMDVVLRISNDSMQVSQATHLRISQRMYSVLMQKVSTENPAISVITALISRFASDSGFSSLNIAPRVELNGALMLRFGGAADASKDRMVIAKVDPLSISRSIEQSIADIYPPEFFETRNGKMFMPMFSCASATAIHEPASFRYIDTIAAI